MRKAVTKKKYPLVINSYVNQVDTLMPFICVIASTSRKGLQEKPHFCKWRKRDTEGIAGKWEAAKPGFVFSSAESSLTCPLCYIAKGIKYNYRGRNAEIKAKAIALSPYEAINTLTAFSILLERAY